MPLLKAWSKTAGCFAGSLGMALLLVLGMTRWLPEGAGGVDHLVLPIILFPAVTVGLFLATLVVRSQRRLWLAFAVLATAHIALLSAAMRP